jgi:phosphonate transport system permease protein
VLGKLNVETMEEVPMRPIEALRSLGARPLQVLFWAIWPQARPLLSSYTVLRWEVNLRASTILGSSGVMAWDTRFTTTCNSVSTYAGAL